MEKPIPSGVSEIIDFDRYLIPGLIGSGSPRPLKEYILEMKQIAAPDAEMQFGKIPYTGTDLPPAAFSIEDTVKDTGFHPEVSFADGIKKTLDWLKES